MNDKNQPVFLVRPNEDCRYNFGKMKKEELLEGFQNRIRIEWSEIKTMAKLWELYQQNNCDEMIGITENLKARFPFLLPAINAHKDRLPQNGSLGRPVQTLIQIKDELSTNEFVPIFKEFCRREEIYGFGDLQVKKMLDEIIDNH